MPNGCDIPERSLCPQFVRSNPVHFNFHFRVDNEGKCRLIRNDEEWRYFVGVVRKDWQERLSALLIIGGNAKDFQDSKTMFKRKV